MKYFLQRDGRTYGPYSYDDLKRYQAENRIGPNDMIRRDDSQQWEPWQQVLNPAAAIQQTPAPAPTPAEPAAPAFGGGFGQPPAQPQPPSGFGGGAPGGFGGGGGFGQPAQPQQPAPYQPPVEQGGFGGGFGQPPAPQQPSASDVPGAFGAFGAQGFGGQPGAPQGGFGAPQGGGFGAPQMGGFGGGAVGPMPPDMQWWLVLVIAIFTCGLFIYFWAWKQASFVKRIDPASDALKFYKYGFVLVALTLVLSFSGALLLAVTQSEILLILPMIANLVSLGALVCVVLARFKMRSAVHNYYTTIEPMGINLMDGLSSVLTFFVGELFIQYHFANIAARKKSMGHPAA